MYMYMYIYIYIYIFNVYIYIYIYIYTTFLLMDRIFWVLYFSVIHSFRNASNLVLSQSEFNNLH